MEFNHITENTKSFIKEFIPWGQLSGKKDNSYVIVLKNNDDIVAYSIIENNENGVVLDSEYIFKDIKDVIAWLEVKKEHQKKGYGSALVKYIRDLYYEKKVPICLYAKQIPEQTNIFYYKLGAILLCDDSEEIIHDRFLAFMKLDQLEKYFKEGVISTTKFELEHSNRKICNKIHKVDGKNCKCEWIWKNDDVECEGCKSNFN